MCAGHCMWGNWWFVPIIFWGIMMIGFIFFFARGGFGRWRRRRSSGWCGCDGTVAEEAPIELLKARYARGEIDREEYEESKKILE